MHTMSRNRPSFRRIDSFVWPALTALLVVGLFLTPVRNLDLWWHLDSGRWMLAHGEYLNREIRSFSMAGAHWPNFSWLFQVVVAGVEQFAGSWGLLVLKGLAWWTIFMLLFRAIGAAGAPLSWLFPVLLFSWQLFPSMHLRPHLFEGIFLAMAVLLMQRPAGGRSLWWSAALVLVWANTHASVVVGAGVLALHWLLGQGFSWPGRRTVLRRLPGALLLCALVFATPNGLDILRVLLGHAQTDYLAAYIREWVAPESMPPFIFLGLLGVLGILLLRRQLLAPGELLLIIFFLIMGAGNKRFLFELVLVLFRPVGAIIGLGLEALSQRYPRFAGNHGWRVGLVPMLATALAFHPPWTWKTLHADDYPVMMSRFPHVAMAVLRPVLDDGNTLKVWNAYGWGGWLGWAGDGRLKVYIDGRTPTVFSEELMLQGNLARRRPGMLRSLLQQWGVQAVVMRRLGPLPISLRDPEWRLVAYDAGSVTYLRQDLVEYYGLQGIPYDPFRPDLHVRPAELPSAIAALRGLLQRDAYNPLAWQHLAELLSRRPDREAPEVREQVADALQRAIAQDPEQVMPRLRLAQWLQRAGKEPAKALNPLLPWVLETSARNLAGYEVEIAELLLALDRPQEALAVLLPDDWRTLQHLNEQATVWMIRWQAYGRLGDRARSRQAEDMAAWLALDGGPAVERRYRMLRESMESRVQAQPLGSSAAPGKVE